MTEGAMAGEDKPLGGPDLEEGIAEEYLGEGRPLVGHAGGEAVLLVRAGQEIFATGATCTHYGGPLGGGLVGGHIVRCPWHHARFDLRTGEGAGAPELNPIACWQVRRADGRVSVTGKRDASSPSRLPSRGPDSV